MPENQNKTTEPIHLNAYSEEFSDVIGNSPKGIAKWGMIVLMITLTIIIGVGFLVQYADVIYAPATIQSGNMPKSVVARMDGKLSRIFVRERQVVKKHEILAYMESTASHEEVLELEQHLYRMAQDVNKNQWTSFEQFDTREYGNLGELQQAYQTLMQSLIQIRPYLAGGAHAKRMLLIYNDITKSRSMHQRLEAQSALYEKDLLLEQYNFNVKEQLFKDKVLPMLELKEQESRLLNKQIPFESVKATLLANEMSISAKEQEVLQLEQQFTDQREKFVQALSAFSNEVKKWKTIYLLIAPDSGIAVSPARLIENQEVRNGQELFYITRPGSHYFGELLLEQEKFGKVEIGQKVLIKVSGFPYQEFGRLDGSISYISEVANKNSQYLAIVDLGSALETEYGRKLPYSNAMKAEAEIITQKSKIINKFLFTFRKIFNKN